MYLLSVSQVLFPVAQFRLVMLVQLLQLLYLVIHQQLCFLTLQHKTHSIQTHTTFFISKNLKAMTCACVEVFVQTFVILVIKLCAHHICQFLAAISFHDHHGSHGNHCAARAL